MCNNEPMNNGRDILDGFRGHSIAMYSTWFWNDPTKCMFDAGEGLSTSLRNYVFAIKNVFLSHGHHDHISGLPSLVLTRGAAHGDKEKPFSVFHPGGWDTIDSLKTYIKAISKGTMCNVDWNIVEPGQDIPISDDKKKVVRPFRVNHSWGVCFGYALIEKRVRLRKEFVGLSPREIGAIAISKGRDSVNEPYEKIVMAYSGDCSGFNPDSVKGADILFHEATFVGDEDVKKEGGHSTVRDAVKTASEANVGGLVLFHLSVRYTVESAINAALTAIHDFGFKGYVRFVFGRKFYTVIE